MGNSTKERIIERAIVLFNQDGIFNVTLRDIANDIGISVGNLTYHFKKKNDLILAIVNQQRSDRLAFFSQTNLDFVGLNNVLSQMYFHHKKYSYYFEEYVVLGKQYPEIQKIQQEVNQELVSFWIYTLHSFTEKGLIRKEQYPRQYSLFAQCLVMISSFWSYQKDFNYAATLEREQDFRNNIWSMIIPCFTSCGDQEYRDKIVRTLQNDQFAINH